MTSRGVVTESRNVVMESRDAVMTSRGFMVTWCKMWWRHAVSWWRHVILWWRHLILNRLFSGLLLLPFAVISLCFIVYSELECGDVDILICLYLAAFLHGINFLQARSHFLNLELMNIGWLNSWFNLINVCKSLQSMSDLSKIVCIARSTIFFFLGGCGPKDHCKIEPCPPRCLWGGTRSTIKSYQDSD